ncbi:proline--tRNA ligase, partial [Deltaproteobacteria bacterium]|nr:proline--tRNA ligase [Deltaproteobacteria bacterium]
GSIGGSFSHEFMVLADTGEDHIVSCLQCSYAANLEKAEVMNANDADDIVHNDINSLKEVETPGKRSVEEVTDFLSISPNQLIKTLIFSTDEDIVAVLVRGDHEINEAKLKNFLGVEHVELADPRLVAETTGAPMGFAGPVGLKIRIVSDQSLKGMKDFITGGNKKDLHLQNVNINRDFRVDLFGDLRFITPEDKCPRCGSEIMFGKGIEVGHIFKLGTKYSKTMGALFLDEHGRERPMVMGCYGIGVSRTVAAAIEQNHDKDGIIFPIPIAPFEAVILPLQINEQEVVDAAEKIYQELLEKGLDVLLDDRDMRAGFKFKDADLLGIPLRITVGTRNLKNGQIELKLRSESESALISLEDSASIIVSKIKELYDSTK